MMEDQGFAEIVPNTLFALGGWLRMEDRPVSWIPPTARGFLPVQGYVLREGDDWLMVDTGLAVHWPSVAEGVASAPAVRQLAARLGVEMPICEAVAAVLAGEAGVQDAIEGLLSRPLRAEQEA